MGKRYDHLTADDRKLIARLHDDKIPVTVIADQLGRHKSTIHRELRRNRTDDGPWLRGYFAMAANQISAMRRRRSAKLHRDPVLAAHVIARLKDGWSPEQIAGRLALDRMATAICHETVYRYVYSPAGRAAELYRRLPSQRRRRRVRYARKPRGLNIPEANTIVKRPPEIGERTTFGHWECDLVAFRQVFGKHNLLARRTAKPVSVHQPQSQPPLGQHHGRPGSRPRPASLGLPPVHHLRPGDRVRRLSGPQAKPGRPELFLLSVSALAERDGREHQRPPAPLLAAGPGCVRQDGRGTRRPRLSHERYATKMLGVQDADGSVQ
jgi:hypothetical protein